MFDVQARAFVDPFLQKIAVKLAPRISANALTFLGLIPALLAFMCIIDGEFTLALLFILLNRLLDGLDGAVARINGATDAGGFLDILCDFFFYGAIPLAFAFNNLDVAIFSAVLLFSFYLNGSAFLAYAWLKEKRGGANITPSKAFTYMTGLTEGFETVLFFCLFCLFPAQFGILALIFAALCFVSSLGRVWNGVNYFRQKE